MVDFRLPNIQGVTTEEQMSQMKSYLYQFVEQLNWAMATIQTGEGTGQIIVQERGSATSPEEAEKTFGSIKALIIKSADIVSAYYDTISKRLEGLYVAQSDFGTYIDESNAKFEATSQGISQNYTDIQRIIGNVAEIQDAMMETNAWIKSGLLEEDPSGMPIYGLEVGQRTVEDGVEIFNKYARFTAGGIYFYLPGVRSAVAWMSGTKLYITMAEITGSLKIGKYQIDTTNGLSFDWVGGEDG